MKTGFLLFLLFLALSATSQKIDNSNYYDFKQQRGTTNWLRQSDAIPIIIDELIKNGSPYHAIGVGDLLKINDSMRLVVTITFAIKGKKYGFLYEEGHSAELKANERNYLNNRDEWSFDQFERDTNNKIYSKRIKPIPANIFLLKETCYWYQYGSPGRDFPISKKIIQEILRQDIRFFLSKIN